MCSPERRLRGHQRAAFALTWTAAVLFSLGCVVPGALHPSPHRYEYFANPSPSDAWTPKIAGWQSRERALPDTDLLRTPASVSGPGETRPAAGGESSLRSKYFEFRAERKRQTAREVADWIQREAKKHYVADGPIDHWATLEETLARNGDDCDGLELLVYHFLIDLGFREQEVFRAIVYRPSDGQHHMVTLWFEEANDPWVIDPTGAMTSGMPRMSEVPGWVPLKVFSATQEFTVDSVHSAAR
jgi:predicted transglutaminase-like cysteine proteinase